MTKSTRVKIGKVGKSNRLSRIDISGVDDRRRHRLGIQFRATDGTVYTYARGSL
jgi:hypothetical protein